MAKEKKSTYADKVLTPEFRVGFPAVFTPQKFDDGPEKYGLVMLFDKSQDISILKKAAKQAVELFWPDKSKRPKNLRSPFRDGDLEKPDLDGYTNAIFVACNTKTKPGLVDQKRQPIISEEDFYAGCYARATVTASGYDHKGNRGVKFFLNNVQFLRDGDPFGGASRAEDDFDDYDNGDDFTTDSEGVAKESEDDMFD